VAQKVVAQKVVAQKVVGQKVVGQKVVGEGQRIDLRKNVDHRTMKIAVPTATSQLNRPAYARHSIAAKQPTAAKFSLGGFLLSRYTYTSNASAITRLI
jgi:hypothetical protein